MEAYVVDWLSFLGRAFHLVAGIAWIGASFYFIWLDAHLRAPRYADEAQRLGVGGDSRTPGDGVRLGYIVPGSAAERAGLRDGDVLVRVGEQPVNTFEELHTVIGARQPGDVVRLVYLRDGRDHVTSATLERSHE